MFAKFELNLRMEWGENTYTFGAVHKWQMTFLEGRGFSQKVTKSDQGGRGGTNEKNPSTFCQMWYILHFQICHLHRPGWYQIPLCFSELYQSSKYTIMESGNDNKFNQSSTQQSLKAESGTFFFQIHINQTSLVFTNPSLSNEVILQDCQQAGHAKKKMVHCQKRTHFQPILYQNENVCTAFNFREGFVSLFNCSHWSNATPWRRKNNYK